MRTEMQPDLRMLEGFFLCVSVHLLFFFKHSLARFECGKSLMNQLLATELSKTTWQQERRNIFYLHAVLQLQWNTEKHRFSGF